MDQKAGLYFTRCPYCGRTDYAEVVDQFERCPDCGQTVDFEALYDIKEEKFIAVQVVKPDSVLIRL